MTDPSDGLILTDATEPGVVVIRLNDPKTRNALSSRMIEGLTETFHKIARDRSVRAVILTGEGEGFCSGADLELFRHAEGAGATIPEVTDVLSGAEALVKAVWGIPVPVICAVNGAAVGGGLSLALASDIRICTADASFSAAFVKFGLTGCELGSSFLLPKVVGVSAAFEMMLTGRRIDAEEAARLGLVVAIVPAQSLIGRALEIAAAIRANSPLGVQMTKDIMWRNLEATSLDGAMQLEIRSQVLAAQTRDHREAVAAVMERRAAEFHYE